MSDDNKNLSDDLEDMIGDAKEGAKKKPYEGIERRRQNRRQAKDRRGEVRFELDKDDRRKNHGRRHDDNSPDFW